MRRWEYWLKPQREPSFESNEIEDYPVMHQQGMLSIEKPMENGVYFGDVGVQIARDGKIWICYNGGALIRFKPLTDKQIKIYKGTE
jgi:sugar lactone lactonase YvrE